MGQGVVGQQHMAFGIKHQLGNGTVAYPHVEFNGGFAARAENLAHSCGDGATAADDQHVAGVLATHMIQCRYDSVQKLGITGHALGAHDAVHPLGQAIPQQSEMVLEHFRRVGAGQWVGANSRDHRLTVVFVKTGPSQWGNDGCSVRHPLRNALPSLVMALQRSAQHCFEDKALSGKVCAQPTALANAQIAQIVVIGGTKRGLAMSHEVKIAHAGNLSDAERLQLSSMRQPLQELYRRTESESYFRLKEVEQRQLLNLRIRLECCLEPGLLVLEVRDAFGHVQVFGPGAVSLYLNAALFLIGANAIGAV